MYHEKVRSEGLFTGYVNVHVGSLVIPKNQNIPSSGTQRVARPTRNRLNIYWLEWHPTQYNTISMQRILHCMNNLSQRVSFRLRSKFTSPGYVTNW